MPVPIICLEATLPQYADVFRQTFSWPKFQHFVTVLLGLTLTPERRTLSGLLSRVAGATSLSRFFSEALWSQEKMTQEWLTRFRHQLAPQVQAEHQRQRASRPRKRGHPKKTQVMAFAIFDDTTTPTHRQGKPGRQMKGVDKHHSTTVGHRIEGHCLVGLLTLLGRHCRLTSKLYRQKALAQAETVPFQSKIDLVVKAIESLTPVPGTLTHVLVDAWYTCRAVWRAALKRHFLITGG